MNAASRPTGDAREPFSVKFYLVGNHIYFVRRGSHLPVSLGLHLQVVAVVRLRGDAPLHRDPAGGLFLSLEERGARLEPPSRAPGPDFVTETPDLEQNPIVAKIRGWRPEAVAGVIPFRGEITVVVPREHLRPLAEFLLGERRSRVYLPFRRDRRGPIPHRTAIRAELSSGVAFPGATRFACVCACRARIRSSNRSCLYGRRQIGTSARSSTSWAFGLKGTPICGACCSLRIGKAIPCARIIPWRALADFRS